MVGIYKITSPKGKVYIGQSVNIEQRWRDHKSFYENFPLQNSFRKYGFNNHIFEVKEECLIEELNSRERYWQDFYNVLGPNGLNCKLTNTNDLSGSHSEETKKKIGSANKNRVFSEEVKVKKLLKFRKTLENKTEEEKLVTKKKRSASNKTVWTDEMKEKRKKTIESKGLEFELERRRKISQTQQNKSNEEKLKLSKKISEAVKNSKRYKK